MKNFIRRFRAIWNPDMYHGWGIEKSYFEGWYFKMVDANEEHAVSVIPGISKDKDGKQHAFLQVLDGKQCKAFYHEYKASDFQPSDQKFYLDLGTNSFSSDHIQVDLPELKGRLEFHETTPWPKMLGAPGIMGWYSFVPFMECYHGVVSLRHRLSGTLELHGKTVDFTGGTGYLEKDWGVSFPRSWIWLHCNNFGTEPISLLASVAHIPWLGSYFIGFIVGFWWEGKLHRFATYTRAEMMASLHSGNTLEIAFRQGNKRLEITAVQAQGAKLLSPISGEMAGKVNESIQAKFHVRFYEKEKLLYDGNGTSAGMELAGDVEGLLSEKWRR